MKDLTIEVKNVFEAKDLDAKKQAMFILIDESHAKSDTKVKAKATVEKLQVASKVDQFAANFIMSGEGMKVV